MNWQDILKKEKAHCGSEKTDEEPIIEKIPDLSGDGKVTQKDVLIGRGVYDKKGNKVKKARTFRPSEKQHKIIVQSEKEILDEIEKEGGALGMENIEDIPMHKKALKRLIKQGKIYIHKDGDIISIKKPSKGRGFTA